MKVLILLRKNGKPLREVTVEITFDNLSERIILNFTKAHVCNRNCRALGLQPPNIE